MELQWSTYEASGPVICTAAFAYSTYGGGFGFIFGGPPFAVQKMLCGVMQNSERRPVRDKCNIVAFTNHFRYSKWYEKPGKVRRQTFFKPVPVKTFDHETRIVRVTNVD